MVISKSYVKNDTKNTLIYNRYNVKEISQIRLEYIIKNSRNILKDKHNIYDYFNCYRIGENMKYTKSYLDIYCGFDIETTKVDDEKTFMYGWQLSLFDNVIWGETWSEFVGLLNLLEMLKKSNSTRIIVWVANLGYEWQFMKHHLHVTDYFFKEKRVPLMIEHNYFVQFRECLSWGGSLKKLANDYTDLIKLNGDLDYTIYRESYNDFTNENEWFYIDFDVLILSHFSNWFFDKYIKNKELPLTVQMALRTKIRKYANGQSLSKYLPKSYDDYSDLVNNVYRGGYVHANEKYIGKIIENVWSYDFTSSYPDEYFNMFGIHYIEIKKSNQYLTNIVKEINTKEYAFYGKFVFTEIKKTTSHSIESSSKVYFPKGTRYNLDNGRITYCEAMSTWLTEEDYNTYKEFYTWDKMICVKLFIAKKEKLPTYLIKAMTEDYTNKAILKSQGKPYAIEKTYVNANYGVNVTKMVTCDLELSDCEILNIPKNMNEEYAKRLEDKKKKEVLLPQIGVQISAKARRKLLSIVYKLETSGNPVIYCDTDSIKFLDNNNGKCIIEDYNKQRQAYMKVKCKEYNLDYNLYYDLGSFDCEYPKGISHFKTLGAKRYLHQYTDKKGNEHFECTIAGLPKKVYKDRHTPHNTDNWKDFFEPFEKNLVEKNVKLSSFYNDDSFVITRLGKQETIKSSLTLNDCDFTLTLNQEWVEYILSLLNSNTETRIYG